MSSALVDWALEATANSTYKLVRYSGIRWLAQKVRRQMALHMKGFGATLYPSRDSLQQARDFEEFLGTAEIIDAIYLVGRSFVRDHSSRYRRFRRVILPDPSSASFRFYETASGEPNLGEAVRRSTAALRENGIKVRWCPELIQQSLLIGDADRKTGWVHVEFVLPCSKANKRPSITVYKSRFEGLVESYKDSFNLLWDLSKEPTDEVKLLPGPNNAIQAPPITSGLSARDATASILRSRLLTPGWVLNFNPSHPRGWKHISFIANGNIGEGKNPNEFVWRVTDSGLLEIKRQDGSLQNYFEYSAATDRFICTNHPKAIGFKNQTIFRDAAMGPIERDVWLSDAIFRAFLGRWERPAVDLSGPGIGLEANQRLHDLITKDFRQLCFEGKLPVWAKSRGTDLWMSVRPSFWKDHRINYLTIMNTSPDKLLVERESDGVTVSDMSEWMTSRAKVDTLWPVGG